MSRIILKSAEVLATMDPERREIADGALFIQDNVIRAVGATEQVLALHADPETRIIDMSGTVVLPGLVK